MRTAIIGTAVTLLIGSAAFAPAQVFARDTVVVVRTAPPPPRHEAVPHARRGYEWIPGYWSWTGGRYVWIGGHWERARHGYVYHRPEWTQDHGNWRMHGGGWQRDERTRGGRDRDHRGPNRDDARPYAPY